MSVAGCQSKNNSLLFLARVKIGGNSPIGIGFSWADNFIGRHTSNGWNMGTQCDMRSQCYISCLDVHLMFACNILWNQVSNSIFRSQPGSLTFKVKVSADLWGPIGSNKQSLSAGSFCTHHPTSTSETIPRRRQ